MEEINKLYNLRRDFDQGVLKEEDMHADPLIAFNEWLNHAIEHIEVDATAMVLSTVVKDQVSSRVVLLKDTNKKGLVFFSNYGSRKGKELEVNKKAALLFFWKEFDRQVRIEGTVKKTSAAESDRYFYRRPYESRIAASVSNQSELIENRLVLDAQFSQMKTEMKEEQVVRPDDWGGYVLVPNYFEFWQGRSNRLHDRICYKKSKKSWNKYRLAP